MKRWMLLFTVGTTLLLYNGCNNSVSKDINTTNEMDTAAKTDSESTTAGNENDNRLNNAGSAKKPKGKMSYIVDGKAVTVDENMVQCMYISMNSTMAQSVISGGNQVSIVHMGLPKLGPIKIESIASIPSVGIQMIIDGVQYNNKKLGDANFSLTKITPAGKNYYVAGTFSGKLTSTDGTKTIEVSDGVFESAYL